MAPAEIAVATISPWYSATRSMGEFALRNLSVLPFPFPAGNSSVTAELSARCLRPRLEIHTLGRFGIFRDGTALSFGHKLPRKPITLLKAIIARGGTDVPVQRLVDDLWAGEDGAAAHESFSVTLHRLRRLLGHTGAVRLCDGQISLDMQLCWVDALAVDLFDECVPERTLELYRGAFLAEEMAASWVLPMRERMRTRFLRHVARAARELELAGALDTAAEYFQRGIEADELAEVLYQGLMRCYQAQARQAEAMAVYRRLRQMLSVTLGISPSPASEQLFRSLQLDHRLPCGNHARTSEARLPPARVPSRIAYDSTFVAAAC